MVGFLFRAVLSMLGLWLATRWVHGIRIDNANTLVFAGLLLGVFNAVIRPIAIILTLPLTVLTLGLFLLVVNAGMVGLTAYFLPGFHIRSFEAAFFTALLVSITGWIGSSFIGPRGRFEIYTNTRR